LLLLGDQLIRDAGIAVFELVKNAYDADSPDVTVTMSKIDDAKTGMIVVEDSGVGMDARTVADVWLEPGTDSHPPKGQGNRNPEISSGAGRGKGRRQIRGSQTRDQDPSHHSQEWVGGGSGRYRLDPFR
jgi:hypothetical protein